MNNYHSNFYNILFCYIKYPILLYENQKRMMLSACTFNFFKNQFKSLKIVITFFDQRIYIFVQVRRGPALNSIDLAIINAK